MLNRQALETEQKALEINLDDSLYGTLAEIGAGQEVARHFFRAGAAAGTIAKTMSAYDKVVSDDIYGTEPSGRYVCEDRLYKMLDHEYELMERRLRHERPEANFFVFADTVAAINYQRTISGNGWLGLRFQLDPHKDPNDIVLHCRMLDNDNQLQQKAIGILGVNLIYACFRYQEAPEAMITSLIDNLHGRIAIDMVRLTGPDFEDLDNRLLSLWLVKHGLTDAAIFGADGQNLHASEFLYRKDVLIVRGRYQPVTLLDMDVIRSANEQFRNQPEVEANRSHLLTEISLESLRINGEVDEKDFLDRAELLNVLGQSVVLSDSSDYTSLINYFTTFKVPHLGLVIGVRELLELINSLYYHNLDGRLLAAFGEVFTKNTRFLVYPALQEGSPELMDCGNMPVPEGVKFLFRHLVDNQQIIDIRNVDKRYLHIFREEVLRGIGLGKQDWEGQVPSKVGQLIKDRCLFGYPAEQLNFDY